MNVDAEASIFVAGHRGLVGSALCRALDRAGYHNQMVEPRQRLDLRNQSDVNRWFGANRPEYVFLAAGTVGGIKANATRQAEFLYDNMMIHANVIEASRHHEVKKLVYLGSACVYPRDAEQPINEDALLTGSLEPTNEGYSLAKIAGMRLCDFYRQQYGCRFVAAMPTNLYGPGDNFDAESSHVIPALLRRFHQAKVSGTDEVQLWGSGSATRDFMHVDDLASALLFIMDRFEGPGHINVGTGQEHSIAELAELVRDVVHPQCRISFAGDGLDGMPRRAVDSARLAALGWTPTTALRQGLEETYRWYCEVSAHTSIDDGLSLDLEAAEDSLEKAS